MRAYYSLPAPEKVPKMKTFNVYRHPVHGVEAVKVGFSWPAFFLFVIWMFAKNFGSTPQYFSC